MLRQTVLLTGIGLVFLGVPAGAQDETGTTDQSLDSLTVDILPATEWTYDDLRDGLSAEELIEEAEVHNEAGDAVGEIEDLIVSADGRVTTLVIESGGFLDIGDATFAYPAEAARFEEPSRIVVPIPETIDVDDPQYSLFRGQPIAEDEPVEGSPWRISRLLNDYAYLGEIPYGWVRDAIIDRETMAVRAVVVSPDVGYGAPGLYAFPYDGAQSGDQRELGVYRIPYSAEEISELEIFIYPGPDTDEAGDRS